MRNVEDLLDERYSEQLSEIASVIELWKSGRHRYASKRDRLNKWRLDPLTAYSLVLKILSIVVIQKEMTYQACIGYVANSIDHPDAFSRAQIAAEVIAICYTQDLIEIRKVNRTYFITTELGTGEPVVLKKHVPLKEISGVKRTILGGRLKAHTADVCAEYLQSLNSVPLCLDQRIVSELEEEPKNEPSPENKQQWEQLKKDSRSMYEEIGDQTFYLEHKYDARGRTYCVGYYVNYQGISYKKAIIQLANKEIVKL